ncbi:DUF1566 domain-containing protein [Myxococcota bacterium]
MRGGTCQVVLLVWLSGGCGFINAFGSGGNETDGIPPSDDGFVPDGNGGDPWSADAAAADTHLADGRGGDPSFADASGGDTALPTECVGLPDFTRCFVDDSPTDRSYDICITGACVSPGCEQASCNTPGPAFVLADTNLRVCYDGTLIPFDCPDMVACDSTDYCGQDAQYGWDTNPTSTRFSVVEPLVDRPVVTDTVTGLMWQGCVIGLTGSLCQTDNSLGLQWAAMVVECDQSDWAGYSDWHLPDAFELSSILDFGEDVAAAIDEVAFPSTPNEEHWSATTGLEYESKAVQVSFWSRRLTLAQKTDRLLARCVRHGGAVQPVAVRRSRLETVEPLVTDHITGLMWQGCASETHGSSCNDGTARTKTWRGALSYCEGLTWAGHSDWYLPNVTELLSIVDYRQLVPAADPSVFPTTPASTFWTSTFSDGGIDAWYVGFRDGVSGTGRIDVQRNVRCVRRTP